LRHILLVVSPGALLLASTAARAQVAEAPPVYASVEMDGGPWSGENCEGGDWNFGWSGAVAVESGPFSDLLQSYTAFDTSQPNQGPIAPAKLESRPVTCRDNHGAVALRAQITPTAREEVQFTVSLAADESANSPSFAFSAQELGMCRVEASGFAMDHPIMVSVNTAATIKLSPALQITLDDLKNGFNKTYSFDGSVIGAAPMCMGAELTRGKLTLRYKSGEEDPTVGLNACPHLAKDETRDIVATGSPEGGLFRFSSTPSDVLAIRARRNNTATLLGATPGKGDVTVEYSRSGKNASATVAGSVVELVSINNGAPFPTLGVYGADGFKSSGVRSFPLKLNPSDGFVQMTVENEALASVVNTASTVQIQPVKVGTTALQAKTLCGTPIGGAAKIEIVLCDESVKQELRAKQAELKGRVDTIVKRITQLTSDAEFDRAAKEIQQSTVDIAVKTGESIVGTLTLGETQHVKWATSRGIPLSKTITTNARALEVTGTFWDGYNAWGDVNSAIANPNDWNAVGKAVVSTTVLAAQNAAVALGKTYGEAYLAAEKFGKDLGLIMGVLEQIELLEPQLDAAIREYIRISTRLQFCETGVPPQPVPPSPPKPDQPKDDYTEIPVDDMPVEIPVKEPPSETKPPPIVDPPREPGKAVYGLACRVQDLKAPGVGQRLSGLRQFLDAQSAGADVAAPRTVSALAGLTDANFLTSEQRAAESARLNRFASDSRTLLQLAANQQRQVKNAESELATWQRALDTFRAQASGALPPTAAAFAALARARDAHALSIGQAGYSSLDVMMETDKCRDRLEVKVDQVRTRYN
jgi:outer membrane biosynthesis protein TonB